MNIQQQKALAWEAFEAGARNGGDSSPSDGDYDDVQASIRVAFDGWWERHLAFKRSGRRRSRQA
jgi:hypothetical protein